MPRVQVSPAFHNLLKSKGNHEMREPFETRRKNMQKPQSKVVTVDHPTQDTARQQFGRFDLLVTMERVLMLLLRARNVSFRW